MPKLSFRHDQSTIREPAQPVAKVTASNENCTPVEEKTPEKPPKVNLLTEVSELKAELAAFREGIEKRNSTSPHLQYNPVEQGRVPSRGCWNCERQGRGARCNHCFNCGGVGDFRYQCLKPIRGSLNSANFPGNRPGLPHGTESNPSDPQTVQPMCKLWKRGELGTSTLALLTKPYQLLLFKVLPESTLE